MSISLGLFNLWERFTVLRISSLLLHGEKGVVAERPGPHLEKHSSQAAQQRCFLRFTKHVYYLNGSNRKSINLLNRRPRSA